MNAALTFAPEILGAGITTGIKAAKWVSRADKISDAGKAVATVVKNSDNIIDAGKQSVKHSDEIADVVKNGSNIGVGNPVKIEGRGNTGRIIPNKLEEQMAMHQVQSNPLKGAFEIPIKLNDARWQASDGWVKMQSIVETSDGNKITIHYVYNKLTGTFDDFKFN